MVEAKREKSSTECELDLRLESAARVQEIDGDANSDLATMTIKSDPAPELPLRNPPVLEATSDLVTLSYLNEPSVLHAIHQRYENLDIYTFSGIVLIATNPFDRVDNLYTDEVVQMYSGRQRGELDPHLFSIAEDAFRCMQRDNKNQTIVVSGESGAGKTMSAKYIMRYFATVENPNKPSITDSEEGTDGLSKVEREILATNPIMEAFGNAKTTRNDNSSRFGKYLEIRFDDQQSISGARIRTYLLERSRIIFHQSTERNYHIFYQLIKGLDEDSRFKLGLEGDLSTFHYVNQGDPNIQGVDDGKDFIETRQALNTVGVSGDQQWNVFEVLAGLLHLGNIQIQATSRSALVSTEDEALVHTCRLLGLNPSELAKWLTKKQLKMRSDTVVSDLPHNAALIVRDSIAKYIYSALFDWLVSAVNAKLYTGDGTEKFIGVLDIYGFEHFKHNSFEQFCINYANEKLQQEFNRHVFKLEQQEYTEEEIDWQYIDFVDNQPCINLIEDRQGILSLLDEESRLPSGSDDGFTQKLLGNLKDKPNFKVPRLGENSFIVQHYAHDVEYETAGFLEKNRDTVPDTVMEVLNNTSSEFLKEIFDLQTSQAEASAAASAAAAPAPRKQLGGPPGPPGPAKRATLGRIFKMSLIELMDTISSTNAHYIRCIKPNEQKAAWVFDGPMVLSQLRACGVLETIRISSKGFPGRWLYEEFASRYALLLPSSKRDSTDDPREMTVRILNHIAHELVGSDDENGAVVESKDTDYNAKGRIYALGKTKVFLRAGMLAKLENLRTKRSRNAAVQIQKLVKMRTERNKYAALQNFILQLQTASRGKLGRIRAENSLVHHHTTAVQSLIRRHQHRKNLHHSLTSITGIQNAFRSKVARKQAEETKHHLAAVQIQSLMRAKQARDQHKRQLKSLTVVQSMVRSRGAKRQLQQLKEEQHSVKHYEENQYRMENKVVELQNALTAKRDEHRSVVEKLEQLEAELAASKGAMNDHISSHNEKSAAWDTKHKELQSAVDTHKSHSENLKEELDALRKRNEQVQDLLDERERIVQNLTMELSEFKSKYDKLLEQQQHMVPGNVAGGAFRQYHDRGLNAVGAGATARGAGVGGANGNALMYTENFTPESLRALEGAEDALSAKIYDLLQTPHDIENDLFTKLFATLEVPSGNNLESLSELDVLFPGNITNLLTSEMWRVGNVADSEHVVASVLKTISDVAKKATGEKAIYALPFWMSNLLEIYSFFTLAYENVQQDSDFGTQMSESELQQYSKLMSVARDDTNTVLSNVYYMYVLEMKKLINKMTVSAVVDDQNIPGFMTDSTSTRFLSNLFTGSEKYSMDDLIMLLTRIITALNGFRLETEIIQSVMEELITLVGFSSFNDMIMRRNFLSWRRGVQISYNATRILEWAKGYGLENLLGPLTPIMQAAKLLQLRMNWSENDSNVIYDICWGLNASQILKVISNYQAQDYEAPMSSHMQKTLSAQVQQKGEKESLVLKLPPLTDVKDMPVFMPRHLEKLEPYIPASLDVPSLREFVELTTKLSRVTEQTAVMNQVEGMAEMQDRQYGDEQEQDLGIEHPDTQPADSDYPANSNGSAIDHGPAETPAYESTRIGIE